MLIINTVSSSRFSLNGIEYLKNYISRVAANKLTIYNNYENADVLVPFTNYSQYKINGVVYESAAALQAALQAVIFSRNTLGNGADINQNNKARSFHMFLGGVGPATVNEVRDIVNLTSGFGGLFNISETDTPVIIDAFRNNTEGTIKWSYLYGGGKGIWSATNQVSSNQLRLLSATNAAPEEIEVLSNTITTPLGNIPNGNYLPVANAQARDLSDPDKVYLFSYIRSNIVYLLQFTGTPGIYGGNGNPQFTGANLLPATNSTVTQSPVPTLQQVLNAGYQAINARIALFDQPNSPQAKYHEVRAEGFYQRQPFGDLLVKYPESLQQAGIEYTLPAKSENDTFAMISDIERLEKKDIPFDFYMGGNPGAPKVTYLTDTYHELDLSGINPEMQKDMVNEIVRDHNRPNNIFITGNFYNEPSYILVLEDCYLQQNEFKYSYASGGILPFGRIHGLVFQGGYLYGTNRPDSTGSSNKVVKINPYNLSDIAVLELALLDFPSTLGTTDLKVYDDKLYALYGGGPSSTAKFLEIDLDLSGYEILFETGDTLSERVRPLSDFVIEKDLIYIPTYNASGGNSSNNTIGIQVFKFSGELERSATGITISTNGSNTPYVHWATMVNNKLIFSLSRSNGHRKIVRFNSVTLSLDGDNSVLSLTSLVTDDNTVFSNGYIYINEERLESESNTITCRLLKVYYNDFSNFQVEIENYNNGIGSHGSINTLLKTSLKKNKTSQLRNDGDGNSPFATMSYVGSIIGNPIPYIEYETQPYTPTPVWTGTTAPGGTPSATWRATKIGRKITGHIALYYPSAGAALTRVDLPLPAVLPPPAVITGYASNGNFPFPVKGFMVITASSGSPTGVGGGLQKTATGYCAVVSQSSGTYRGVVANFEYWTD